jgi:hypothetical protein
MLSCKDVARLVSEALERDLGLRQRWAMGFHLLLCSHCARFRRQLRLLGDMARRFAEADLDTVLPADVVLSSEARERIKRDLRGAGR